MGLQQKFDDLTLQEAEEEIKDNNVLNMDPVISSRPRLIFLLMGSFYDRLINLIKWFILFYLSTYLKGKG